MERPSGTVNHDPEQSGLQSGQRSEQLPERQPAVQPAEEPRLRHEPPFIVSPYYLSALGVAGIIAGALQGVWPVAAAGAVIAAIAVVRFLVVRYRH